MLERLRQLMLGMNLQANSHADTMDLKRLVIGSAAALRQGKTLESMVQGMSDVAGAIEAEHQDWIDHRKIEAIVAEQADHDSRQPINRGFDACDLRIWLSLAKAAGLSAVPAREILSLSEAEHAAVCRPLHVPDTAATRKLQAAASALVSDLETLPEVDAIDPEAVLERLHNALDDVPEGWMVRSARCGGSDLKALAMVGIAEDTPPEVRFGPNLEIGPGWVRSGNRRRILAEDRRIVQSAAQGPGGVAFLARPWQAAARYCEVDDPHRADTPLAGKGRWPAEWRAIVENGKVIAVSSYYGWSDTANPHSARQALLVRERAQRLADLVSSLNLWPRYLDLELARTGKLARSDSSLATVLDERFGRRSVCCTLDFIETAEGPMFLEAGPGVTPFGGGHPCAFAGVMIPELGTVSRLSGVAFRTMDHVLMADPSTWRDGDRTDCILTWEEVMALAEV